MPKFQAIVEFDIEAKDAGAVFKMLDDAILASYRRPLAMKLDRLEIWTEPDADGDNELILEKDYAE